MKKEILIVDDDQTMRRSYKLLLESEGFAVRLARDGDEAIRKFRESKPDLVLMDVMMPRKNGCTTCQEIRVFDTLTPIVFFTALPSEITLVRGLGFGGDDYIDKARPPEEMIARINAALRRSDAFAAADKVRQDMVTLGAVSVNFSEMTAKDGDAAPVRLTRSEMIIFRELAAQRGSYVTVDRLIDLLAGEGAGDPTIVRKFISTLRAKLGRARDMICNIPGVGYCLLK